jgi:hypothetical protein
MDGFSKPVGIAMSTMHARQIKIAKMILAFLVLTSALIDDMIVFREKKKLPKLGLGQFSCFGLNE